MLIPIHEHPLFIFEDSAAPSDIIQPMAGPMQWLPHPICGVCKGSLYDETDRNTSVHSNCAEIIPDTSEIATEGGDKLIHKHRMQFLMNIPQNRSIPCSECGGSCKDKVYGCVPCRYFIHPGCRPVQTGGAVQHDWCHPCELIGYMVHTRNKKNDQTTLVSCNVCGRRGERGRVIFHCNKCNFNLDSECINISPATPSNIKVVPDSTEYFSHEHPFILYNNMPTDRVECRVCGKYCSNSAYGCFPCAFFFHPAELKLPQKIYHPFHLYHPLFLLEQRGPRAKCNACRKDTPAIAYICKHDNCSFFLDIICGEVRLPAIKYEAHNHLLQFRERTDDQLKCNACDKTCASSIFSCLYCDWNLHYTCGPLPSSITYKCHEDSQEDSLLLTNALAEHEDEMDDELYCDVCEKQRDPLLPTYQCTDHCNFVAEIGCVISEVMSLLKGDRGDHVELRDPFGQLGKLIMPPKTTIEDQMMQNKEEQSEPTLRLSEILKPLNEDESRELRRVFEASKIRESFSAEERFFNDPEKDNVLRYSDKDYTQFMKFLDRAEVSEELRDVESLDPASDNLDPEEEVVNVGDHYKALRTFAPILRQLLSKHGDICAASTLSPKAKQCLLNMLCTCIYSMRNTKVVDITTNLLLIWWTSLRICQVAGFEVQSVFDHLKRVADAFFGLYVGKQADKVERDIAKLSRDLEELKRKRDCIASSTKLDLVDKCLMEASVLKQGKAITERLWESI